MIQLSAHCRLGKAPRQIDTRTGTVMVVCSAAANIPVQQSDDTETVWLDLTAFGRTGEDLLRHQQGDLINAMGTLAVRRWADRQSGEERQSWQLTVDALVSARTTRPRGGRKGGTGQQDQRAERRQAQREAEAEFLDDAVPF